MVFAKTPVPPYYAVIFTSQRTNEDNGGYDRTAKLMDELVSEQKGFLGVESYREQNGAGITVSYWDSLEAIKNWKDNPAHQKAQEKGRSNWYSAYTTRVCRVEKDYSFYK